MEEKGDDGKDKTDLKVNIDCAERRDSDRRISLGKGYMYISIVGWICRREHSRRRGDSFNSY